MDNENELWKAIGAMQASLENVQKDKEDLRSDIKLLKVETARKFEKLEENMIKNQKEQTKDLTDIINNKHNEIKEEYKIISVAIKSFTEDKTLIKGGWKAYGLLFGMIAGSSGLVKLAIDFFK